MAERTINYAETLPVRSAGTGPVGYAAPPNKPRTVAERSPALLRRVNEVMRAGREGQTEPERIPFFCECRRDDCYEPVWLTADAYDERRTEALRLILPGHEHGRPER